MYAYLTVFYSVFELFFNYVGNFLSFFIAKSQRTGIRLRRDTFRAQKVKKIIYTSPNNQEDLTTWKRTSTITYFKWPLISPMGLEPPRSFPIGRYCKLDTGMQQPKLHPELQMQQKLQVDLLLRLANSTSLVPTWHGAPSQVDHTLNWST